MGKVLSACQVLRFCGGGGGRRAPRGNALKAAAKLAAASSDGLTELCAHYKWALGRVVALTILMAPIRSSHEPAHV